MFVCVATGERLDGIDSEAAAQKLRGHVGTTVTVKVHSVNKYFKVYAFQYLSRI